MVDWKIGPTFGGEIKAAGVSGDGWSFSIKDGTFLFAEDAPQAVRDGVAAVYAAHDPMKQTEPPTLPWPPDPMVPTPRARLAELPVRWQVDQRLVLERLDQAHLFDAFTYVLDSGTVLTRALWQASQSIWNDDPLVVGLLQKAKADPATILARP